MPSSSLKTNHLTRPGRCSLPARRTRPCRVNSCRRERLNVCHPNPRPLSDSRPIRTGLWMVPAHGAGSAPELPLYERWTSSWHHSTPSGGTARVAPLFLLELDNRTVPRPLWNRINPAAPCTSTRHCTKPQSAISGPGRPTCPRSAVGIESQLLARQQLARTR
jgi:hypothetical protein